MCNSAWSGGAVSAATAKSRDLHTKWKLEATRHAMGDTPLVVTNGFRSYSCDSGHAITIDRDHLDVGTGASPQPCTGVNLDFTAYNTIRSGSTGPLVKAGQCLLQAAGHDPGHTGRDLRPRHHGRGQNFQAGVGLTADGVVGPRTWTALLSRGTTPTLQNGSTGEAVSRLQRALTAALGRTVAIDGIFASGTGQAVRDYQSSRELAPDGIVGSATWGTLQSGR